MHLASWISSRTPSLPVHMGRDCELSTTGVNTDGQPIPSWEVTRRVLAEIGAAFELLGFAPWLARWGTAESQDCLRSWTPNGQCYYSDMAHVEVCTAATRDPRLYAAQSISTLLVVEEARKRAEATSPGARYSLSTANADPLDPAISWGTHLNASVSTALWEQLFLDQRHPAVFGFVVSAVAAAIPFFGCGHLLTLRDGRMVYSLSGRAHHLGRVSTLTTTEAFGRGLLNSRREAHGEGMDRLHLIGFDFALIGAALQCCFLQCCLAAAEAGFCGLGLFAPVQAMQVWSWKLDLVNGRLPAEARLTDDRSMTLPSYMRELCGALLEMHDAGVITEDVAPSAGELLPRVYELAQYLEEGALDRCATSLDWAAKLLCLREAEAELNDPAMQLLDHDFASTDPERGSFWRLWKHGLVDPLVTMDEVRACLVDGPPENRGWGRGRLVQRFPGEITAMDWSWVELRLTDAPWGPRLRIEMPHLESLNCSQFGSILEGVRGVRELHDLLASHRHIRTAVRDAVDGFPAQLACGRQADPKAWPEPPGD